MGLFSFCFFMTDDQIIPFLKLLANKIIKRGHCSFKDNVILYINVVFEYEIRYKLQKETLKYHITVPTTYYF